MNLRELGLTEYEAKAYEALIKLVKATASQIAAEADVSYGRIYEVLTSLERKGLVKIIPEKTKKFIASDPENLMKLVEAKKAELDKIKEDIKKLEKLYASKEEEPVIITRGKKAFYKIERELPKPKKSEYNIKYTAEYQPVWVREKRESLKKGVIIKELVRFDRETENNIKKWLEIHKNIKKIENEGIAMSIIDDSVMMLALIKSNTTLLIKDKSFIKLMKDLFLTKYKEAEQIEKII